MKKYLYLSLFFLVNTSFSTLNALPTNAQITNLKRQSAKLKAKNQELEDDCKNLDTENIRLLTENIVAEHILQEFLQKKGMQGEYYQFSQEQRTAIHVSQAAYAQRLQAACAQTSNKKRKRNQEPNIITTDSSSSVS